MRKQLQQNRNIPNTRPPPFSHLEGVVAGRGEKEVPGGMEGDALHRSAVGIVVLEELVRARVPEFNGAVAAPRGDAGAIGVEFHIIHL